METLSFENYGEILTSARALHAGLATLSLLSVSRRRRKNCPLKIMEKFHQLHRVFRLGRCHCCFQKKKKICPLKIMEKSNRRSDCSSWVGDPVTAVSSKKCPLKFIVKLRQLHGLLRLAWRLCHFCLFPGETDLNFSWGKSKVDRKVSLMEPCLHACHPVSLFSSALFC